MKKNDFIKLIDINKNYFRRKKVIIDPYFNGESLLHPDIFDLLKYVVENDIVLGVLHTNLSMDIDIERLLAFPLLKLVVNIGGITQEVHERVMCGTQFGLVKENLKRMFRIDKHRVYIKFNPTPHNLHQIKDIQNFIRSLGGNQKNYIVSTIGFTLPSLATTEEREYYFENVVSEDMNDYLRFTYDETKPDKAIRSKTSGCAFQLDGITYDGKFTICWHDLLGRINLGNAFEIPVEEIINSKAYRQTIKQAKNMAFDFCKECN